MHEVWLCFFPFSFSRICRNNFKFLTTWDIFEGLAMLFLDSTKMQRMKGKKMKTMWTFFCSCSGWARSKSLLERSNSLLF
uniref:Uncharacterized protein n=1 Tax=Rhizophora mucronata TaxID=61149 RepID=A0A2P2NCI3_RHIMU